MKLMGPEINIDDMFGDMKVIDYIGKNEAYHKLYKVECAVCKRDKIMKDYTIRQQRGIEHSSCGKGLKTVNINFYRKWTGMRQRTTNPNYEFYSNYGGRGISSEIYKYFIDFYDSLYGSYLEAVAIHGEQNTSLDRINVDGNYEPGNCRWITFFDQHGNTTRNKYFEATSPKGQKFTSKNQCEFAREHDLSDKQINACLVGRFKTHLGWKFKYIESVTTIRKLSNQQVAVKFGNRSTALLKYKVGETPLNGSALCLRDANSVSKGNEIVYSDCFKQC